MNIIQKIEKAASANNLSLNISGTAKKLLLYGKVQFPRPYKIISSGDCSDRFTSLCSYLVQNKECNYVRHNDSEYTATFVEGDFKVEVESKNGNNFICIYKIN